LAIDYKITPVSNDAQSAVSSHSRSSSDSSSSKVVETRSYSGTVSPAPVVFKSRKTYKSSHERALVEGSMERRYKRAKDRGLEPGAPLHLARASKSTGLHKTTAYKASSVSGEYAVETGILLSSSASAHKDLQPLDQSARRALSSSYSDETLHKATHFLTWTVATPLDSLDVPLWVSESKRVGAFAIPPLNSVPAIDLQTDYHPSWVTVVTDRIRNRMVLPPIVPRSGWPRRANRSKAVVSSVLDEALDACDDPSYTVPEQQLVHRAWNVLAMRSSSVSSPSTNVFDDASILLTYMAAADRLSEFE